MPPKTTVRVLRSREHRRQSLRRLVAKLRSAAGSAASSSSLSSPPSSPVAVGDDSSNSDHPEFSASGVSIRDASVGTDNLSDVERHPTDAAGCSSDTCQPSSSSSYCGSTPPLPEAVLESNSPPRPDGFDKITPKKNIDKKTARPPMDDLIDVSFAGDNCSVSNRSNNNGSNERAHILARATHRSIVQTLERKLGLLPGQLCLDTRLNMAFLSAEIHKAYDRLRCVFLPSVKVLGELLLVLQNPQEAAANNWPDRAVITNDDGYIHHEEVFPCEIREFYFVPLSNWAEDIAIPHVKHLSDGTIKHKLYTAPFVKWDRTPSLPLVNLHCSPYFIVYGAYLALQHAKAPSFFKRHVRLVKQIGELMYEGDSDESSSSPSPDP